MTKTVVICDVTGEEGAMTISYAASKTERCIASGRSERVYKKLDLSHAGAMKVLQRIFDGFPREDGPGWPITLPQLESMIEGMRKS